MTDNERPEDLIALPEVQDLLRVSMRTVFRLLAAGALTGYKEHKRRGRPVYVSREQAADVAMRRFTRLHGRRTPPS